MKTICKTFTATRIQCRRNELRGFTQQAITDLEHQLKDDDSEHARLSLKNLNELKEDYSIQYKKNLSKILLKCRERLQNLNFFCEI